MINPHIIVPFDGEKRIIARFLRQEWVGDTCHPVGEEIPIDVTARVLALPLEKIRALRDESIVADDLCRPEALGQGTQFSVSVERAILDYFQVASPEQITEQALLMARAGVNPVPAPEIRGRAFAMEAMEAHEVLAACVAKAPAVARRVVRGC